MNGAGNANEWRQSQLITSAICGFICGLFVD